MSTDDLYSVPMDLAAHYQSLEREDDDPRDQQEVLLGVLHTADAKQLSGFVVRFALIDHISLREDTEDFLKEAASLFLPAEPKARHLKKAKTKSTPKKTAKVKR